jgi:hypothetical protein
MFQKVRYPALEGAAVSCPKIEKLRFDVRVAEAEAEQRHSARRAFLKSQPPNDDLDGHLSFFIEDLVIEAEMRKSRTLMSLDWHADNCPFCSRVNSN